MSKRNVYINFAKPGTIKKWSDVPTTYLFLTDGNKFLPGVLTYTYTISVVFAGDDRQFDYKVTRGPYYDYGTITNKYNSEGKSSITLSKLGDTYWQSNSNFDIPEELQVKNNYRGIFEGRIRRSNRHGLTTQEILEQHREFESLYLGDSPTKGQITITYSYAICVNNVDTDSNLYVITARDEKSAVNDEELGLYVSYKYNSNSQTYTQIGNLELKPVTVSDTWNSTYKQGCSRIRYDSNFADNFKTWMCNNYLDYVRNSKTCIWSGSTCTYKFAGKDVDTASQISQRSRIYQVPGNELSGSEDINLNVKLYYDGSYLCEVNPDVQAPNTEDNKKYNKKITYSYLVNTLGKVTLDGLAKGSYIYSYSFVPKIKYEIHTEDEEILDVTYTADLSNDIPHRIPTIGDLFTGDTDQERLDKYKKYARENSFKKETVRKGITYITSYEICTYNNSENILDCYAYTTYTFAYELQGIYSTSVASTFTYMCKNSVSPEFKVYYSANKNKWILTHNEHINYIHKSEVLDAGEYVKLQFSDDELRNTTDLKYINKNNKITITSHSDTFYLNIVQSKSNFNSFVPKITTSPDISFYQTVINGLNFGWRIAFVHTNTATTSSEIYIGVPKTDEDKLEIENSFDDTITNMYDICIKVNYDITDEDNKEDDKEIKTVSEIKQAEDSFYSSHIDVPQVNTNTEYFWTDDMFNLNGHEYKNAIAIQTASGIEYFGIRSKRHGTHERNDFRFNNENPILSKTETGTYYLGYDLSGIVVQLNTTKRNDYIYSFINGEQCIKINDDWKGKNLFPSKMSSYEYLINKEDVKPNYYLSEVNKQDQATNINKNLQDLYENGEIIDTYSSYSIAVPYIKHETNNDYLVIKNSSLFEKSSSLTYDCVYEDVPDDLVKGNKYVNLYYQEITYTKLNLNKLTSSIVKYFRTLTTNNCFYKYNVLTDTYTLCTIKELNKLTSLDDIYERYVIYKEITNSTQNENGFIQKYDYNVVSKNEQPENSLYYAHKVNDSSHTYTYIQQGVNIVTDDSIQYYTYTYALITDDELYKYKQSSETVYIKENYRVVRSESEFNELFSNHITFYSSSIDKGGDSPIQPYKLYPINSSQLLDDIDLTGNSIYINERIDNGAITYVACNISNLKELVSEQVKIASAGITTSEEIETRKNLTRRNILKGKTTFAASNVVKYICAFDFNGKYIEYADIYEHPENYEFIGGKVHIKGNSNPESYFYIFIKGTDYTPIDKNLISLGSKQQYYAWRIDKVPHNQIRTLNISNPLEYVYVDATEFGLTHIFDPDLQYSGNLKNPVTGKVICIAKVNNYGFIEYTGIEYYNRKLVAKHTSDVFMHPNKVYYKKNEEEIKTSGVTPIIRLTHTELRPNNIVKFKHEYDEYYKIWYDEFNKDCYELQWNKVKFYNNTKITYSLIDNPLNYEDLPYPLVDNEYIKSTFFYQTYTINDGISKSKGGAYYTNIYVFDRNNGALNKTLYLNQNIIDINAYNYTIKDKYLQKVTNDIILSNLSPLNYKDYYVSIDGGNLKQLSETTESPSYYWNMSNCELYTYVKTESEVEYACQAIPGSYQYYSKSSNVPITFVVDDNLFGIVANNFDISATYTDNIYSYNLFDLEVVKLYKMSKNNYGNVIQEHTVKETNISKNQPFTLANDVEYTETGSYTWHNPTFASHIYNTSDFAYDWKLVEENTGYWTKDYDKNIIPFQTASYIFYPDANTISNTSSTYSFIPNSYVLSSKIVYPEISYNTISTETEEQIYYSYVLGGVEYHYHSSKNIQVNPDGTYTGLVKQYTFDKAKGKFIYATRPIQLTQHKTVVKNSKVTNIVNQEQRTDTTWFAYKTSLALTNESVPVLYNTELMPATTKQIQYWDEETSSYQLKSVIVSYAYYSYQYMYDTKPFKVSSYLFKASYLTIDNFGDLGTYVSNASSALTNSVKDVNSDFNKWTSYYRTAEYQRLSSINKAYDLISAYVRDGFVDLSRTVSTLSSSLTNSVSNVLDKVSYVSNKNNERLSDTISTYSYVMSESINALNTNIVKGIDEHKDSLSNSIDTLASYVKNIVLGESIEIPKSVDIVSKNGIVVSYNSTMDSNLDSLGELLLRSFITTNVETYSYVDENGLTHNVTNYSYTGLGDTLKRLEVVQGMPTKQEFIVNLTQRMFANIDFDTEIVDDVKYDENGNITEKKTHKNNPTEMAKKVIYRANILWDELAKGGYCKDTIVEEKQNLLTNIKSSAVTSTEGFKKILQK